MICHDDSECLTPISASEFIASSHRATERLATERLAKPAPPTDNAAGERRGNNRRKIA
jgi:hypothetical protein